MKKTNKRKWNKKKSNYSSGLRGCKKILIFFCLTFLIVFLCGFQEKETISNQTEENPIHIKEDISKIQLNTIKIDAKKYGMDKISKLVSYIESAKVVNGEKAGEINKGKNYYTVSLIYKDGSKDVFSFFKFDGVWYMQDPDGKNYENAGFIEEFVNIEEVDVQVALSIPSEEILKERLELEQQLETLDLRYTFAVEVREMMSSGTSEADAVNWVREKLAYRGRYYEYAQREGLSLSEEELAQRMEDFISTVERADNYSELEKYYEDAGTTFRQSMEKQKDIWRLNASFDKMYEIKCEEFRNGQDKIGDKVCEDATEYWSTFLMEVVIPETEKYDMSEFQKKLDEAEAFYFREQRAK